MVKACKATKLGGIVTTKLANTLFWDYGGHKISYKGECSLFKVAPEAVTLYKCHAYWVQAPEMLWILIWSQFHSK